MVTNNTKKLDLGNYEIFNINSITKSTHEYISLNTSNQLSNVEIPRIVALDVTKNTINYINKNNVFGSENDLFAINDKGTLNLGFNVYTNVNNISAGIKSGNYIALHTFYIDKNDAKISQINPKSGTNYYSLLDFGIKSTRDTYNYNNKFNFEKSIFKGGHTVGYSINNKGEEDFFLVTGIEDYYDIGFFQKPLSSFKSFLEENNILLRNNGDANDMMKMKVTTNILKVNSNDVYLSFASKVKDYRTVKIYDLISEILRWIEKMNGKTLLKTIAYARYGYALHNTILGYGNNGNEKLCKKLKQSIHMQLDVLRQQIIRLDLSEYDNRGIRTINALYDLMFSLQHFSSKISAQYKTGGVIYVPLAVNVNNDNSDTDVSGVEKIEVGDTITILSDKTPVLSNTYYVWKVVSYNGGAGDTPSGTSGVTQRVYISTSGVNWQNAYEEENIISKIAETLRLKGLPGGDVL